MFQKNETCKALKECHLMSNIPKRNLASACHLLKKTRVYQVQYYWSPKRIWKTFMKYEVCIQPQWHRIDNSHKCVSLSFIFKVVLRLCTQSFKKIVHPGYSYMLLVPLYFGSAVMFWVMQAELENLKFIAVLGIIHGALEDLVSYIFHVILKRKSAPWGSFRTPRRERLMADIVIISMFSESIGIVCVNGLLYVYQFIYLQNISLLKLVQKFVINTSVPLVIEWFFTSVSLAIETPFGCDN